MPDNMFLPARILLPKTGFETFSVIACDQFTSEPEYWAETERIVGDKPSALRLVLPEIRLSEVDEQFDAIHDTMQSYLDDGVFDPEFYGYVLVERTLPNGVVRPGIVGMIDLENYEFKSNSQSPIRPTENVVPERLPPRTLIRTNAPLELPHAMLFADDVERTIIESFYNRRDELVKLYDFELMQGGGHLRGWLLPHDCGLNEMLDKLFLLENEYATAEERSPMYFAVGDGNHSLAAAKSYWNALKMMLSSIDGDVEHDPARYALVELVNLHSPAIEFHAIHRVISGCSVDRLLAYLREHCDESDGGQCFIFAAGGVETKLSIRDPETNNVVGSLQRLLDRYLAQSAGKMDYVHGSDVALELSRRENTAALLLEPMQKPDIFPVVAKGGMLERKSFSIGSARDKRYYLEARRIQP